MALEIGRTVEPAERKIFELAEDRCPRCTRPFVVSFDVFDGYVNAVDDPRCRQPATSMLAFCSVMGRALVIGSRPTEHHRRAAELQFGMRNASIGIRVTLAGLVK